MAPPWASRSASGQSAGGQARQAWATNWLCKWCVHPRTGEKWWNRGDLLACSLCSIAKGNSFGGAKSQPQQVPSTSTAATSKVQESKKQQELLKDKDRQLTKLREQLREAKGQGPEQETQADTVGPDQQRLASIAASLKMLGDNHEPAFQAARTALQEERDGIKTRIVRSKPFTGQMHHYTARIETLERQRAEQQASVVDLQRQRAQLDEEIQQLENAVAEVAKDIVDLQHQRWQVSAQAPTATPDHFTLKAMVPALEIPVDKLGEMLKGLGADTAMSGGILQ